MSRPSLKRSNFHFKEQEENDEEDNEVVRKNRVRKLFDRAIILTKEAIKISQEAREYHKKAMAQYRVCTQLRDEAIKMQTCGSEKESEDLWKQWEVANKMADIADIDADKASTKADDAQELAQQSINAAMDATRAFERVGPEHKTANI